MSTVFSKTSVGIRKTSVCLQAFGDFSWFKVTHGDITEFATGVHNGFHQKQKRPAFQRAIYEVLTYLQVFIVPLHIARVLDA